MKAILYRKQKGQGVVEYAGALVIAAAIVAAVLAVGPGSIGTIISTITGAISTYLSGKATGLQ